MHFEIGKIMQRCKKYDKAIRFFLKEHYKKKEPNAFLSEAIHCAVESKSMSDIKTLLDYLLGHTDGVSKVKLHLEIEYQTNPQSRRLSIFLNCILHYSNTEKQRLLRC